MKKVTTVLGALATLAQGATLTGLWTFDDAGNPGKASVGTDLTFAGTSPAHSATLADDGANSQTGVITSVVGASNTISASHGIAANGGGAFVNQYSIVADLFSPAASRGSWRTIYQTNTSNSNDGEYFIRNSDAALGVGDIGYSSTAIDESSWTRLVITVDLANGGNDVITYLDGAEHFIHPEDPGVDGRFSLDPTLFFFTDNDGDDAALNVGALGIYDGVLTPAEVTALGGAGTAIVPEPSSLSLLALCGLVALGRRSRS